MEDERCKSLCIEKTKTEGLELQENEIGRFSIKHGQQKGMHLKKQRLQVETTKEVSFNQRK